MAKFKSTSSVSSPEELLHEKSQEDTTAHPTPGFIHTEGAEVGNSTDVCTEPDRLRDKGDTVTYKSGPVEHSTYGNDDGRTTGITGGYDELLPVDTIQMHEGQATRLVCQRTHNVATVNEDILARFLGTILYYVPKHNLVTTDKDSVYGFLNNDSIEVVQMCNSYQIRLLIGNPMVRTRALELFHHELNRHREFMLNTGMTCIII